MSIEEILKNAVAADASDIFLIAGLPLTYKCSGSQNRIGDKMLLPEDIKALIDEIYEISKRQRDNLDRGTDDDFSFRQVPCQCRQTKGCPGCSHQSDPIRYPRSGQDEHPGECALPCG